VQALKAAIAPTIRPLGRPSVRRQDGRWALHLGWLGPLLGIAILLMLEVFIVVGAVTLLRSI
jgi:hypothetical protein